MDTALEHLLAELEQFGQANDAAISDRPRRMLKVTRDTAEFLAVLVRACLVPVGNGEFLAVRACNIADGREQGG